MFLRAERTKARVPGRKIRESVADSRTVQCGRADVLQQLMQRLPLGPIVFPVGNRHERWLANLPPRFVRRYTLASGVMHQQYGRR